jgi:glutamate racemase
MEKQQGPIGVFDSGYGGLTVLKELQTKLPNNDFLYLGDNARAPYGNRSFDVVYEYTLEAVKELFSRGCSLVILACNTASAKALRSIQQNDLPKIDPEKRVLGVIRPSAEVISDLTKTNHVGIVATQGTIQSNSYKIELEKYAPNVHITQKACPIWVPLIENNLHDSLPGKMFIKQDIELLLAENEKIDTIVLACTHYPLVKNYLEELLPDSIQVIAQGAIVAEKLVDYLNRHPEMNLKCSKNGRTDYLTTENETIFNEKAGIFMQKQVAAIHIKL